MTEQVTRNLVSIKENLPITPPQVKGLVSLVGNTPLIPLRRIASGISEHVQIFAKAEWFNPGGSIKDRPALNIIQMAQAHGDLRPGMRLLDATSGNTGIAYATFGAVLDVPITLTIPANASPERISILRSLGVELVLTDPLEGTDGAIRKVLEMVAEEPLRYYHANQYDNPANWQAHYLSTGPEIVHQTEGRITHFLAGMGTSGTIMGVGRYLREYNPEIKLLAVQPDSPFHGLEGLKHFQTALQPGIYDSTLTDQTVEIPTEGAYEMVRRLAREEGLFVGISSGANALAAIQVAQQLERGVMVTVFPDSGYKYLSDRELWG